MSLLQILLVVVLIMLLFGAFPVHSYSANWGYAPSGLLGVVLLVVVVLFLMGRF